MKINDIANKLGFKLLAGANGIENTVESVYTCDLLSWVIANSKENQIWFTVMGNVNAVAVATLKNLSGIVLTDNAPLDTDAKNRANQMNIPIYSTQKDSATALIETYELLTKQV